MISSASASASGVSGAIGLQSCRVSPATEPHAGPKACACGLPGVEVGNPLLIRSFGHVFIIYQRGRRGPCTIVWRMASDATRVQNSITHQRGKNYWHADAFPGACDEGKDLACKSITGGDLGRMQFDLRYDGPSARETYNGHRKSCGGNCRRYGCVGGGVAREFAAQGARPVPGGNPRKTGSKG